MQALLLAISVGFDVRCSSMYYDMQEEADKLIRHCCPVVVVVVVVKPPPCSAPRAAAKLGRAIFGSSVNATCIPKM